MRILLRVLGAVLAGLLAASCSQVAATGRFGEQGPASRVKVGIEANRPGTQELSRETAAAQAAPASGRKAVRRAPGEKVKPKPPGGSND